MTLTVSNSLAAMAEEEEVIEIDMAELKKMKASEACGGSHVRLSLPRGDVVSLA